MRQRGPVTAEPDLAAWLARLESLHPSAIELGLERVAAVAQRMALLPVAARVVTVAGTNGKGSTIAVLDAILRSGGVRTGCYTSPHLQRYNERVRIDGTEATDRQLVDAFQAVEWARDGTSLTYFEFGTLAALKLFQDAGVDCLLLEVGLGGRLDAVNIVDADLAVITSIALDHQDWLGDTREQIALEKAGILRPGCTAVCADPDPPASLLRQFAQLGCELHLLGREFEPLPDSGGLRGDNVAAALTSAALLGIDVEALDLQRLLQQLGLEGRVQRARVGGVTVWLDVAHNPAAAANLADAAAPLTGPGPAGGPVRRPV